jgi:hypothetical protein
MTTITESPETTRPFGSITYSPLRAGPVPVLAR